MPPPPAAKANVALGLAKSLGLVALGYGLSLFFLKPPSSACAPCQECPQCESGLAEGASAQAEPRTLIVEKAPNDPRDPATYSANTKTLVRKIRRFVSDEKLRAKCISIVKGEPGSMSSSFAQAGQDWLLFHNYFSHIPYGKGRYIDIGSNHPFSRSNSYFFDVCLGWKGICVEPNRQYHALYEKHKRTCKLINSCVADRPQARGMNFSELEFGALQAQGAGEQVQCRSLSELLTTYKMQSAELATIDIEGAEYDSLRCFPFRAHGIDTWLVETNKADEKLYRLFSRGGYAPVADIIMGGYAFKSETTRVGISLDTVFRQVSPTFILGPDFLPGRFLDGKGPRPACKADEGFPSRKCPEQMPAIYSDEVHKNLTLKDGACGFVRNAYTSRPGQPDGVLATSRHPQFSFDKA